MFIIHSMYCTCDTECFTREVFIMCINMSCHSSHVHSLQMWCKSHRGSYVDGIATEFATFEVNIIFFPGTRRYVAVYVCMCTSASLCGRSSILLSHHIRLTIFVFSPSHVLLKENTPNLVVRGGRSLAGIRRRTIRRRRRRIRVFRRLMPASDLPTRTTRRAGVFLLYRNSSASLKKK